MKKLLLSSILFFILSNINAQAALNQFLNHTGLENAGVGISVIKMDGSIIIDHNAKLNLIPASSLKAIVSMGAFEYLPDTFRYQTSIHQQGEVNKSGFLNGRLIINTNGDPSLCSSHLDRSIDDYCQIIYTKLRHRNINCVNQIDFISNSNKHEAIGDTWLWQDIANYYGGGAHSFNILRFLTFS